MAAHNPLADPTRPPAVGYVQIVCTEHARFVAWCSPPAPSCTVACSPSCTIVDPRDLPPPAAVDPAGS